MLGGIKIVGRHGIGGKGIGFRTVFSKLLQGVALPGVKHLVLQIVRDACRSIQPFSIQPEAGIHAAVTGGEKGVLLAVAGLWDHADLQAVCKALAADRLADPLIKRFLHACASLPFRK